MHINKLSVPTTKKGMDIAACLATHLQDIDYVISGRPMHAMCLQMDDLNGCADDARKPKYVIRVEAEDLERTASAVIKALYDVYYTTVPPLFNGVECPTFAVGDDVVNIYVGDQHGKVGWEKRKECTDYVIERNGLKIMNPIYMLGKYLSDEYAIKPDADTAQLFYNWARREGYTSKQCADAVLMTAGSAAVEKIAQMETTYLYFW